MTIKNFAALLIAIAFAVSANTSHAGISTFFGVDNGAGGAFVPGGNAVTARSNFLSNLSGGVGTENFESLSGSVPLNLSFPGSTGSVTATITGSSSTGIRTAPTVGAFATSGTRFLRTSTSTTAGEFSVNFSSAIAAFGFYATDLGDSGGGNVILNLAGGGSETLTIPVTGLNSGNLLFYGFVSDTDTFTSISFQNTAGSGDVWGFDDMTVGDIGQVTGAVPEPGSLAILAISCGIGLGRRRRR
ncbi:PEP-CTERM sorting domain-containing protein [Stieleria sp. JC731]|uniref:PEP-CTERM sorting domain-containing protein n=1 Tax=Pirellulaceae TaxID=2691357 RepID=UPI001E2CA96E|nr:PEP-CTERM sorting domain-containing protein [Stieleria sp. JC731]MCC9599365.1 PEP-CTERM sorting domain-containing protein [Stieleria sp. JC731]